MRIENEFSFKNFKSAKRTLSGIEVVHMLKKDQIIITGISVIKSFLISD
ncbi:hypothetical protein IRZ71_20685 [Flavobacterium sp. ANB]|nr:hypothetical protein [Flavobacterium sp. ANB]